MTTREILQKQGTDVTWEPSGGTEVLTLTSLADGDGRAGEEHDFGATHAERIRIALKTKCASAPTAGESIDVFWSSSHGGTDYDGEATGSDAAYNSEEDAERLRYVGTLKVSNDTDAQQSSWNIDLPARYGLPVVFNQSGVALSATAGDHVLTVTPLVSELQSEV